MVGPVLEASDGALLTFLPAECFKMWNQLEDICSLSVTFMEGVAGVLDGRLGIPEVLRKKEQWGSLTSKQAQSPWLAVQAERVMA